MGMTQTEIQFAHTPAGLNRDTRAVDCGVEPLAYTADQVCAALQISKVTLWRLERRGLLHSLPHLRHKRYAVSAVRALVG